jgi:Protein of unknown function (DUF2380)
MYENKRSSSCITLDRNPTCPNSSNHHCWVLGPIHRLGLAAVALSCWVVCAAADSLPSPAPLKIAVFEFELEDFSAAGQMKPVPETSYLAQATDEAKQQLRASGRYTVIDAVHSDILETKGQGFRNCGGCEAPTALSLGADEALIGVVTKISMTEYIVRFRLSNAHNGELIATYSTDLRMGADYSWSRGVRWLMQNRMLTSK